MPTPKELFLHHAPFVSTLHYVWPHVACCSGPPSCGHKLAKADGTHAPNQRISPKLLAGRKLRRDFVRARVRMCPACDWALPLQTPRHRYMRDRAKTNGQLIAPLQTDHRLGVPVLLVQEAGKQKRFHLRTRRTRPNWRGSSVSTSPNSRPNV